MASVRRVLAVTAGLAVAGLVVGALTGVVVAGAFVTVSMLTGSGGGVWNVGSTLLFSGMFGGALGMVLGPLAAWLLMRHVPIGRAMWQTALGTAIGSFLGLLFLSFLALLIPAPPLILGLAGFAAAAVRLRITHRKRDTAVVLPSED